LDEAADGVIGRREGRDAMLAKKSAGGLRGAIPEPRGALVVSYRASVSSYFCCMEENDEDKER
jgi:hypothetical protein